MQLDILPDLDRGDEPLVYGPLLLGRVRDRVWLASTRGPAEDRPFGSVRLVQALREQRAEETRDGAVCITPACLARACDRLAPLTRTRSCPGEVLALLAFMEGRPAPDALAELRPEMRGFLAELTRALEDGAPPWRRPWAQAVPPTNAITRKAYRGLNVLTLLHAAARDDRRSSYWCTARQAQNKGGRVREGARPVGISKAIPTDWKLDPWAPETFAMVPARYVTRWSDVFNLDEVEGLAPPTPPRPDLPPDERAERVVADYLTRARLEVEHLGQDRAVYFADVDRILLPSRRQFDDAPTYYEVVFHELAHSTGHGSRLKRPPIMRGAPEGSPQRAHEELVAELCAVLVCQELGLAPDRARSVSYCHGWARAMRGDLGFLSSAMTRAQAASDLILGRTPPTPRRRRSPDSEG